MKQKYVILKNNKKNELIIKEFAELNKDAFTLTCEETFHGKLVQSAINKGSQALIATLRTKHMYPTGICAAKIAEEVINLFKSKDTDSVELYFDDKEILTKDRDVPESLDDSESESVEIDELLEDDASESTYDDNDIDDIIIPINVADSDADDEDDGR
jgi:hypothetical protein